MTSKHCSGSNNQDAGDRQIYSQCIFDPVPILRFSSPFMPPHEDTVNSETAESSPALEAHIPNHALGGWGGGGQALVWEGLREGSTQGAREALPGLSLWWQTVYEGRKSLIGPVGGGGGSGKENENGGS